MARAARLWAVAAALLGAVLPALGQASGTAQVVDTAPSGTCSATTYKGTVVVRNTADLWRCLDLDGNGTANWTQSRAVRYQDFDTNSDGATDLRISGDYDGDGTLEIQDLQSALDNLCDTNGDGTQDRTQTIDEDGDGTVDDAVPYCGTLLMYPGQYVGGDATTGNAAELTVKWSGVTIEGTGRLATMLRSGFPTAKLFSRTCGAGGTPCGSPSFTHVVNVVNGTSMMRRVTLRNFRVEGLSSKTRRDLCTTYSCVGGFDADNDGTSDGAQHGVNVNNPSDVIVEDVHVHNSDRIAFLWGTDTAVYESQVGTLTYNRVRVDGSIGEHCMAGSPVYLQVMDSHLEGCDWTGINAKAIEYIVYDSDNVGNYGMQITGNWISAGSHGIRVFPSATLTGGPHAFNWKRFLISGNTFLNTGVSISIETSIGTSASAFSIGNIAISGNTFTKPLVYPTPISGGFINLQEMGGYGTITGVAISGNQFDQDSTASIGTGSSNAFQHINVSGADAVSVSGNSFLVYGNNSSTAATDEMAVSIYGGVGHSVTANGITLNGGGVEGVKLNGVNYSIVSGNSITGAEYPAAVTGWNNKTGIELLNSSDTLVTGNEIGRTKAGIYAWGSGGNSASNSIMMNRCRITGACVWIDGGGTNTNNTISYNSASDCDPDGTGSVTTNTYAWLDVNAAGSNFWADNAAQACWADAAAGGSSSYVKAGHGSAWVLDSDFDSVPDYDTLTWLRYSDKSGVDFFWDTGFRFRNTAGTYFTTIEGFEPYQNATVQFINAPGIVPLTPGPSVPTSQCATWNSDGYLIGSGSACGGSGSPGGSDTYVQYNSSGSFAGESTFTYTAAEDRLRAGKVTIGDTCTLGGATSLAAGTLCFNSTSGLLVADGSNWYTANWSQNAAGEVWYSGTNYEPTSEAAFAYNAGTNTLTATTFSGALSGNASTATNLAANPSDCSTGNVATTIAANGDLTCKAETMGSITFSFTNLPASGTSNMRPAGVYADAFTRWYTPYAITLTGMVCYVNASKTGGTLAVTVQNAGSNTDITRDTSTTWTLNTPYSDTACTSSCAVSADSYVNMTAVTASTFAPTTADLQCQVFYKF